MIEQSSHHVFVIDQDSAELERLLQLLKENRYQISQFNDLQLAYKNCLATRPDIILFEPQVSNDRGSFFIRQMKKHYCDLPVPIIIITQETDLEKRLELLEMGIDDFLSKPYYPEEAVARIHVLIQENKKPLISTRTENQGFAGSLKEMNLIDLIQTMEIGAKSGIIYLYRGDKEGQVHIQSGKIVEAIVDDYPGVERAFLHMLTWIDGSFSVVVKEVVGEHAVPPNTQHLFDEGARIIDQWRKLTGELPSLQTHLLQVDVGQTVRLSNEERMLLRQFHEPATILQAIDRSEFEDFYTLNVIKSLLEKGLLIKTEQTQQPEERAHPMMSTPVKPGVRGSKNKYSHIFSLFRRKRQQERESPANGAAAFGRQESITLFDEKIINKVVLTKAELLLIRQKFSN
jgi:CheY-like chemotaxis protein